MTNFFKALGVGLLLALVFIISQSSDLKQYETFFVTILGVATFIFGIFIGFSISERSSRIDKIRENDSAERSQLISISLCAKEISKDFYNSVLEKIDEYLMATLDYKIWDYHLTQTQFENLFSVIAKHNPEGEKDKILTSQMISGLNEILVSRKNTIGIIEDRLSAFEWTALTFLSAVILISLAALNSGGFLIFSVVMFLSLSLALLLSLLYSLDNLSWKEEDRIFEPYSKTFESIGLVRYYPEALITQKRVKNFHGKDYRKGIMPKEYPDMSEKKIEIVKNNS